jgi:general secretion pathway protein G
MFVRRRILPTEADGAATRSGFTLMEMLIVVAIIVALAGLGGYYFLGQLERSKKSIAATQCRSALNNAVTSYITDHGQPPPSLQVLMTRDAIGGPYLQSSDALVDPWNRPYQYNPSAVNPETGEQQPEIFTFAPDGTKISNLLPTHH